MQVMYIAFAIASLTVNMCVIYSITYLVDVLAGVGQER